MKKIIINQTPPNSGVFLSTSLEKSGGGGKLKKILLIVH